MDRDAKGRFIQNHKLGKRIKKGQHLSKKTEFKKGVASWIKGKVFSNTYGALHHWCIRNIKKSKKCDICKKSKVRLDLANIDHKYMRNERDWATLCRSCHRIHDILNNWERKIYE